MIFKVRVANKDNQQSEEPLAFVRYCAVKTSGKEAKTAAMRHLVWETVPLSGEQRCRQPSYGSVTALYSTYVCIFFLPCGSKGPCNAVY